MLTVGALAHAPVHYIIHYIVSLLGLLGKPRQLASALTWFNELAGKQISCAGSSAPYAVMVDTIVRLKSGNVGLLKKQLARADAGDIVLTRHHRFTYEKALERIRKDADRAPRGSAAPITPSA